MRGTVIKVDQTKGFGFIKGEDGTERFFHRSCLQRTAGKPFEEIQHGQRVEFEAIDDAPKGPRAIEVLAR